MKKLVLGVSSGVFYSILSMAIALLSTPYFLKFISKEEFGIYFLVNNLIIWSGLLNLGLRGSFKLQLSTAVGKGKETESLISTAFISQCFVAFVILCIGSIFIFFIPYLLIDLYTIVGKDLQFISTLLLISFAISLISNPISTILSVYNRDSFSYSLRSGLLVAQTIGSILLLSLGAGIKGLAISAVVSEVIFISASYFLLKLKLPCIQITISNFKTNTLRKSLSIGKWFLAGFLAQLFIRHTDLFLIEKFAELETITSYIISSKLYFIATSILLMALKIISPQLTKLIQSNSSQNDLVLIFIKCMIGYVLASGVIIYFLNEHFIYWWVGKSFYIGSMNNFILLLIFYFGSFNYGIRAILMAQTKLKSQKTSALVEGILHITLAIVLGYLFQFHGIIVGIFIATLVSCFFNYTILISGSLFSKVSRRELTIMSFYIFALSLLLFILPSANLAIDIGFIFLFLISLYMICQNEVNWFFKSLRAR